MRVILAPGSAPRLEGAADFKRFNILLNPAPATGTAIDLDTALAPVGVADGEGHAWVRPDALRTLSPHAGHPDWEEGFAAMLRFAGQHGWTDDQGRIRAHIERATVPAPIAPEEFRGAMRRFASGVCVVAVGEGDTRSGMTVSAFTSVSADPPLVLVCLNRSAAAHGALTEAGVYSINILAAGQSDLAMRFAGQHGVHGAARFDARWLPSTQGAPILGDCLQTLVCTPAALHEAGSHTLLVGQVIATSGGTGGEALVNFEGALHPSGKAA